MFYENFLNAIDTLPEDKKYKICYEFCKYGITGELPKNEVSKMLCIAVSASIQKYQGRGGAREGAGRPKKQENQIDSDIQKIQKNQKNQKIQKQQTETININKNININDNLFGGLNDVTAPREQQAVLPTQNSAEKKKPSKGKENKCILLPEGWYPKESTIAKLKEKGVIVDKAIDKFINSCIAKKYKYADFDRALLSWDWEKNGLVVKHNNVKIDNELRAKL